MQFGSNKNDVTYSQNSLNKFIDKRKIFKNFLTHMSRKGSYHSLRKCNKTDNKKYLNNTYEEDSFYNQVRKRKFSFQGDYSSKINDYSQNFESHNSFEETKKSFKELMGIRKEMGNFLRKNSMESGINVNMLMDYVNCHQ